MYIYTVPVHSNDIDFNSAWCSLTVPVCPLVSLKTRAPVVHPLAPSGAVLLVKLHPNRKFHPPPRETNPRPWRFS